MTIHNHPDPDRSTPRYKFEPESGLEWRGTAYSPVSDDTRGHTLLNLNNQLHEYFTHEQIAGMFAAPIAPLEYHKGRFSGAGARLVLRQRAYVGDLDEDVQEEVLRRLEYCKLFLRMQADGTATRSDKSMIVAIAKIASEINKGKYYKTQKASPKPRTLRNWIRKFERDGSPLALCDAYGSSRKNTHFTAEEEEILQRHTRMYASAAEPTMKDLWDWMEKEVESLNEDRPKSEWLRVPSIRTLQNRIAALPPAYIDRGRLGDEAAAKKWSAISEGMDTLRLMERVEMDEWRMDLHVLLAVVGIWKTLTAEQKRRVPKIRVWVTAAIDVASKALVGFRVHRQSPSGLTAIGTLEMTVMDKTSIARHYGCEKSWPFHGSAETVAVDTAAWYTNQPFRVTVNDMGATLFLPPAGKPSCRGTIERFFRTTSENALKYFSGRTWGTIEDRRDGNTDADPSVLFEEVAAILTRYFVDVYHETPHDTLHGETPREAWERLERQHKVVPPPTGALRRHIFGINMMRVVGQRGVRFMGVHYQSAALQALRRKRDTQVLIRVDRQDLGQISVWNGEGWITVKAVHEEFVGMSIWVWTAMSEMLRKENAKKSKLGKPTMRRAKEHLRARGDIARLEAGIDNPLVTEEQYEYWESKLDHAIEITEDRTSVPEDFDRAILPEGFLDIFGIGAAETSTSSGAEEAKLWRDPTKSPPTPVDPVSDGEVPSSSRRRSRRGSGMGLASQFDSKE